MTSLGGIMSGLWYGRLVIDTSGAAKGVGFILGAAVVLLTGLPAITFSFILPIGLALGGVIMIMRHINADTLKKQKRTELMAKNAELMIERYHAEIEAQQEVLTLLEDKTSFF